MANIRYKKLMLNFILLLCGIIAALLLCELILAFIYKQPLYSYRKGVFEKSEEYVYNLKPNTETLHVQPEYSYILRSNSYGFRGKEPDFNARFRVLIVGDSFGMGQGVEEDKILCTLAQDYFDENNMGVDIFNTSVCGYSIINEGMVLKKWLPLYKPDLVILLLSWNDVGINKSLKFQDGYLVIRYYAPTPISELRVFLNQHSRVYCLFKRFFYIMKIKNSYSIPLRMHAEQDINQTAGDLNNMYTACRGNNADFVVVIAPSPDVDNEGKNYLFRRMEAYKIPFIDWHASMPEGKAKKFFYRIDGHMKAEGQLYYRDNMINLILEYMRGDTQFPIT